MSNKNQEKVSNENSRFWDELCGSQLARHLGIHDSSPQSLKKFDEWYFDFYPYLNSHIRFEDLAGKKVLEIGLGYGTVSQKIAESGAVYQGLDIAPGPVAMVNNRLAQMGLGGGGVQGNILNPPFEPRQFDAIVAIGCLHHTGDLGKSVENCFQLLRPGGRLIFMVYYAYSYRRWLQMPWVTLSYFFNELKGFRGVVGDSDARQRASYDKNLAGEGAPHTDWISKKSVASLCKMFSKIYMKLENIDSLRISRKINRNYLLKTKVPNLVGLDLYVSATK